jgi:Family of unknown function (DUF6011)
MEHTGNVTIVQHCAVFGRLETEARWVKTSDPTPYAQHERALHVYFSEPRKHKRCYFTFVPDSTRWCEILIDGKAVWDSRELVPCDPAKWEATAARFLKGVPIQDCRVGRTLAAEEARAARKAAEEARRAELRRLSDEVGGEIEAGLACHAGDLARVHEVCSAFFAEESAGKTYQRRPNLSLRLAAEGEPPARLLIHPGWNPYRKALDTSRVQLELITEEADARTGKPRRCVEIGVGLTAAGARASQYQLSPRGVEKARRLAGLVAAFVRDPAREFARSADRCCICGRALVDGVSRARGIGPECLRQATAFRRFVEQRLAAAQAPAPAPADVVCVEAPPANPEPEPVPTAAGRRSRQGLLFA